MEWLFQINFANRKGRNMGNNDEIRKRMETYRSVLLALVWIIGIAGMIAGLVMIYHEAPGGFGRGPSFPLRPYGIGVLIVSALGAIFGHFLVNVSLAIPFILLNNGDYLAAIVPEGKIIKSATVSDVPAEEKSSE